MKEYKHILVATDFSPAAFDALKVGEKLANELNAKLSIVHCIESVPTLIGTMQSPELENAQSELAKLAEKVSVDDMHLKIAFGHTKKALIETIDEVKGDLIIVGSHGIHGITRLLGSTANAIMHTASCDVLVVRATE